MNKLLGLSSLVLGRLSIPKKMLLLGILLIAPLIIQTTLFIHSTNADIEIARIEQQGIEYSVELRALLQLLPLYRGASYAEAKQLPSTVNKDQLRLAIDQAIERVEQLDWRLGSQLGVAEHLTRMKSSWQIISNDNSASAEKQFERFTQLIEELLLTMALVADNSGLVLDPNIETYYLMLLMVYEAPKAINTTQTLRSISLAPAAQMNAFGEGAVHAPTLVGVLRNQQTQLIKVQSKVLQENPQLREKMGALLERTLSDLTAFSSQMLTHDGQTRAELFDSATRAVDSLFELYDFAAVEFDLLLEQQISAMVMVRNRVVISIGICLLVGLYLFTGFYMALVRDLMALVKASKSITVGQMEHRIAVNGKDELSTVAIGFNDMAAALEQSHHEVSEAYRKLEKLTKSDPLTGLPNRRFLDEVLAREWQRAIRNNSTLSVLMLDIDHFKQFNDLYGHAEGDECLRRVADELAVIMKRGGDFVARYGGEEFIIISPETDAEQASELALTILKSVESLFISHEKSVTSDYLSVSIGIASMLPKKEGGTSKRLVEHADRALYKAKEAGRNCYVVDTTWRGPKSVNVLYPNKGKKS